MRTAPFLFISAALHAAALAYPAFHNAPEKAPPIVVSIVEPEGGGGGGGNSSTAEKAGGAPAARPEPQKQMRRVHNATPPRAAEPAALAEAPQAAEPAIRAPTEPVTPVLGTQAQTAITISARESAVNIARESGVAASSIASTDSTGASYGIGVRGGPGSGDGGTAGNGSGGGAGDGNGAGPGRFVQASYLSCPKTDYPEAARRAGWEGTVMIEVAVDAEGRPKSSQVQQSSGFDVLDRAALDNIQRRCRFHPARRGDARIATSIKIPVVFRLADTH